MTRKITLLGIFVLITDINECKDDSHNCHADGICTNTNGSFYCTCQVGYTGDGVNCSGNKNCARILTNNLFIVNSSIVCM